MQTYQVLKVFVSCPSDMEEESKIAEEVISRVNDTCKDTLGIMLDTENWKNYPPITPGLPEERIQDILNERVKQCHIFLLMLYRRYGSVEPGQTKSNTEREVEIAIKRLQEKRQLMFLSYFKNIPPNIDPGTQQRKVKRLRESLRKQGIWFSKYSSQHEFRSLLAHDLYNTVLRFRFSKSKYKAISDFWQLGVTEEDERNQAPRLLIVYPPVSTAFMGQEDRDRLWLRRLVPNVVFEDFKAMQKIEKSLRLIGFRNFKFFSTASAPTEMEHVNRLWLCLPRNPEGLRHLQRYERKAKFRFTPAVGDSGAELHWRRSLRHNEFFRVHSPLAKYLEEQRHDKAGGEWSLDKARVIAKDFAVIARFSDTSRGAEAAKESGTLKDYFVAGIRGLGTWGAAWYLDRRYNKFRNCEEDQTIQILLEVTYRDERIVEVEDVSDKPEEYFAEQNRIESVREFILKSRKIS